MKSIFRYAGSAIALVVFGLVAAAVILYQNGSYDFSFAPRVHAADAETGEEEESGDTEAVTEAVTVGIGDNVGNVFDSSAIEDVTTAAETESAAASTASSFPTVASLKNQGYACVDSVYSRTTHRLALVTGGIAIKTPLRANSSEYTLSVYMGCIIYNDGSNKYALGINGVVSVAGINKLTPAYLRDAEGHPLWRYQDKYYYLLNNSNKMVEVSVDVNYAPTLTYDSPEAYSEETGALRRYYIVTQEARKIDEEGNDVTDLVDHAVSECEKAGEDPTDPVVYASLELPEYTVEARDCLRWGYVNESNYTVIPAQYYFASEFDETGCAVVAGRYGIIKVINQRGSTVISLNSRVLYPDERNRRPVWEDYYLPDTFGIESIGMFGFDHGYIQLRYMQYDYKKETEVVQDYNVLARADGTLYDIPSDYNLVSYSEGVMLLEKDGCYGMLDITGKWIAQPIYTYAQPFVQGLAVIGFKNGKSAMIDTAGRVVLPFDYDYISNASSGVVIAHSSTGWSIFNIMSK